MKGKHVCCQAWEDAQKPGTDNEAWGSLLSHSFSDVDNDYYAGICLPPIRFCPWCGAKVVVKEPS